MNIATHNHFAGNTQPSWPFSKKAAEAPVEATPKKAPYAALRALFQGDKQKFDAFVAIAPFHILCMDPLELLVKASSPFEAAPARIAVKEFAGDKACRIAALRNAIPAAVQKVFYGRGSHGFRNYISVAAADELEAVALELQATQN